MPRWLVALVVGLAACSNSTAPSGIPDYSGTWLLTLMAQNASNNGGLNCQDTKLSLTLNQSDTAFTGTHTGGSVACVDTTTGQHVNGAIPPGRINGTIGPAVVPGGPLPLYYVSLDLDTTGHYAGSVQTQSMFGLTGSQKVDFDAPRGATVLLMFWDAKKQ